MVNQGTYILTVYFVVLDLPINPWSSMVLNQYVYEWAKLHQVFYGALNIHLTVVSAATLICTINAITQHVDDETTKDGTNRGTKPMLLNMT